MDNSFETSDSSHLLEDCSIAENASQRKRRNMRRSTWAIFEPLLPGIVILLALSNAFLLFTDHLSGQQIQDVITGQDPSYFGSPQTALVPFYHDWVGLLDEEREGHRYKDEEWVNFFPPGGGAVSLSAEFIKDHGLPPNAATTDEDPNKKIYMIAGYHQLHCLSIVRDALYWLNGTLAEWPDATGFMWDHVLHCVEAVRKGLACSMDPTLINLNETWPGIPNGQLHQCRNLDTMHAFAAANWHNLPKDPRSMR